VRDAFALPFLRSALEQGGERDLILRGRFSKVAPELVGEHRFWQKQQKRRAAAVNLAQDMLDWERRATHYYAVFLRAGGDPQAAPDEARKIEELWRETEPIDVLLKGAQAEPRGAEVTYLLGLCMHERAERTQARLDLAARTPDAAPHTTEADKARTEWKDALGWWQEYTDNYAKEPPAASARTLRGRAQAMLGDRAAAIASWEDTSGTLTDLEKVANLYQAAQLKKK
jgi:hypothetical protein